MMAAGIGAASASLGPTFMEMFSQKKAAAPLSEEQQQLQLEYEALVRTQTIVHLSKD